MAGGRLSEPAVVCGRLRRCKPFFESPSALSLLEWFSATSERLPSAALVPVERGPAFRLARKRFPHGRLRLSPCTLQMTLRGWSREVGAGCRELPKVTPCVEHLLRTCAPAACHRWMSRGEFAPLSASTGTDRHRWRARSIRQTRRSGCRQLGSLVSTGVLRSIRCA